MKVFVHLAFIASMIFLFACGNGDDNSDDGFRVAIVTSLTGVDDRAFNQSNYEGIQDFIAANPGSTVQHVHETSGALDAAVQYVERIAGDFDVIVMPGFQFSNIGHIAMNHPYTKFILIDVWPEPFGDNYEFPNVRALQFAEYESGFLAGVVAALESQAGRIAFVGGYAFPPVVNYQFGFESGVNYANMVLGTDVTLVALEHRAGIDVRGINVGGNYIGSFSDSDTGFDVASELLAEGVDIILVTAGSAGRGVYNAVIEYGGDVRIIITDTDLFEHELSSDRDIVLASVFKATGLNVRRSLESLAQGNFSGGNHTMRTDTDSVGIITAPGHHRQHQMPVETVNRINELFGKLRDGTIVPASNFNGYTPYNFPGLP